MEQKLGNFADSRSEKKLGSFEMWYWRRLDQIGWTDRVRSEEVLHTVKVDRNIIHTIQIWKCNSIGHILSRNCLIKQQLLKEREREKLEVTGR